MSRSSKDKEIQTDFEHTKMLDLTLVREMEVKVAMRYQDSSVRDWQ